MIRDDARWISETAEYELTCLQCGKPFNARRADAKFCSAVCRKGAARRRDQIERSTIKALDEIAHIRALAVKYPDLEIPAAISLAR